MGTKRKGYNVYKLTTHREQPNSPRISERMSHEVLIDLYKAICRRYDISLLSVADSMGIKYQVFRDIFYKRQRVTRQTFILMCKALEARICTCIQHQHAIIQNNTPQRK